ncbi:MAG: tetratricopeptide repeat protein [Candidatus Eisenbacteria bacterium]|nr:tetratricopeptide repeat protein [Candidatus Eisenbacteria bacterium]
MASRRPRPQSSRALGLSRIAPPHAPPDRNLLPRHRQRPRNREERRRRTTPHANLAPHKRQGAARALTDSRLDRQPCGPNDAEKAFGNGVERSVKQPRGRSNSHEKEVDSLTLLRTILLPCLLAGVAGGFLWAGSPAAQTAGEIEVPPSPRAVELYNEGLELASAGQFTAARGRFEEALIHSPQFHAARYNFGLVLRQLGEYEAAAEAIKEGLPGAPQPEMAQRILGDVLARLGRVTEALAAYDAALELDPEMTELHFAKAQLLYQRAETDEQRQAAIAAYDAALEADPDHPAAGRAYTALAKLHYGIGQKQTALEMYREALGADPDNAELHYNIGVLQSQIGQLTDAVRSLQRAIELRSPNGKAQYVLAGIYYNKLQQDEQAIAAYEAAAADPDFSKAADAAQRADAIREYLEKKAAAEAEAEAAAGE